MPRRRPRSPRRGARLVHRPRRAEHDSRAGAVERSLPSVSMPRRISATASSPAPCAARLQPARPRPRRDSRGIRAPWPCAIVAAVNRSTSGTSRRNWPSIAAYASVTVCVKGWPHRGRHSERLVGARTGALRITLMPHQMRGPDPGEDAKVHPERGDRRAVLRRDHGALRPDRKCLCADVVLPEHECGPAELGVGRHPEEAVPRFFASLSTSRVNACVFRSSARTMLTAISPRSPGADAVRRPARPTALVPWSRRGQHPRRPSPLSSRALGRGAGTVWRSRRSRSRSFGRISTMSQRANKDDACASVYADRCIAFRAACSRYDTALPRSRPCSKCTASSAAIEEASLRDRPPPDGVRSDGGAGPAVRGDPRVRRLVKQGMPEVIARPDRSVRPCTDAVRVRRRATRPRRAPRFDPRFRQRRAGSDGGDGKGSPATLAASRIV